MQMRSKLECTRQESKSIHTYAHELLELFNVIGSIDERTRVIKFWDGLRMSIRKSLWRDGFNPEISSWQEVYDQAVIIEISESVLSRGHQSRKVLIDSENREDLMPSYVHNVPQSQQSGSDSDTDSVSFNRNGPEFSIRGNPSRSEYSRNTRKGVSRQGGGRSEHVHSESSHVGLENRHIDFGSEYSDTEFSHDDDENQSSDLESDRSDSETRSYKLDIQSDRCSECSDPASVNDGKDNRSVTVASDFDYSSSEEGHSCESSYSEDRYLGAISFEDNDLPLSLEPEVTGSPLSSDLNCADQVLDVCLDSDYVSDVFEFVPAAFGERMEGGMHRRFVSSHADAQGVMYKHATAPQFFELVVVHCKVQNEHSPDRFQADIISFPIFVFSSVISFCSHSSPISLHTPFYLPSSLYQINTSPSTNFRAASITTTFGHDLATSRCHVLDNHTNPRRLIITHHSFVSFHDSSVSYSRLSPGRRLHQAMLVPNWPHITILEWLDDVLIYHHHYKFGIWITKRQSCNSSVHRKILENL
ncbi:hypothetical protein CVT26_005278 [Gymnopilus dilepis]|uniref:Retrotransposon gag domain-containing protein n=1 Tax=Gymnopilus dilepis TaxID=231916 RepID=A0A409X8C4_9AGAR|nr:hypothetical protein CVT26_005278 [Gymnopilus dilepis]